MDILIEEVKKSNKLLEELVLLFKKYDVEEFLYDEQLRNEFNDG